MTTKSLLETATLVESPSEGPWKVRLISEGKGSSGIYEADLLENYKQAFNDVLSFENHPSGWDGPTERNFTQIVGKVVGETWTDTDERGKVGIYANWEPDPDHKERLERYRKNLGLSIYIEGEGHANDDGDFVVDTFNEHDPFRSVDVVIAAGRGGRFEESALREIYSQRRETKPAGTPPEEGKDNKMDEKDIKAIVDGVSAAFAEALKPLVSAKETEAEKAAQVEADQTAVAEGVKSFRTAVEAINEADLSPAQVKSLMALAESGEDITAKIAEAKEIKADIEKLSESAPEGRIRGPETDVKFGAWK